ncbi:MAG: hypothetical protein AAGF89_17210, partial [Bacteroidota bacterium]
LSYRMIYSPEESNTLEHILQPNHADNLILLRRNGLNLHTELVTPEDSVITLNTSSEQGVLADPKLLGAVLPNGDLKLMVYGIDEIHESLDTGRTWTYIGDLPDSPWRVGVHMSKANPDYLILGNVNLYYSENSGADWDLGAFWVDYYDDVIYKLHADMMYFKDFQRPDGSYSTFVSSHGGLSVNTDDPTEYLNLSLGGLNNAQYYSTATKRETEDVIYAGSQDQGLQFQISNFGEVENYEQVISGDYGNLSYSHTSDLLYSMYPRGGLLTWNAATNQYLNWTDTPGGDGFIWITPFMVVPDEEAPKGEVVYIAGGSADGGSGSYLIKATDPSPDLSAVEYVMEDVSLNFLNGAGGQITAVGYSPLNTQRLYVGTEAGRFYWSDNGGENWTPTLNFLPEGFYLYGQAILASTLDEDRVWFGGSGYSNPAVYQSDDGGFTFYDISEGLPPTVVMRLAANNDESLLFAATESGPYVYLVAEERWFYLGGLAAPAGRYYSVEYLPNSDIARFASYNRGVWDFEVSNTVSSLATQAEQLPDWSIYPNPTNGPIFARDLPRGTTTIQLTDQNGRVLFHQAELDLSTLPAATYFLTPMNEQKQPTGRLKTIVRR